MRTPVPLPGVTSVLTQARCVVAGQLESAVKKVQLIARLQDEVAALTATVEVEQRVALQKLQTSSTKGHDHESRSTDTQTERL